MGAVLSRELCHLDTAGDDVSVHHRWRRSGAKCAFRNISRPVQWGHSSNGPIMSLGVKHWSTVEEFNAKAQSHLIATRLGRDEEIKLDHGRVVFSKFIAAR